MIDCRNKTPEEIRDIKHSLNGYGEISWLPGDSDLNFARELPKSFKHERIYYGKPDAKWYCLHKGVLFLSTDDIDVIDIMLALRGIFPQTEEERKIEWEKMDRELHPALWHFLDEGHKVLDPKYHAEWDRIVPGRISDMYCGMELGHSLEIIKHLNKGEFKEAEEKINSQGHSCMSFSLVLLMVKHLCDNGEKFYERMK